MVIYRALVFSFVLLSVYSHKIYQLLKSVVENGVMSDSEVATPFPKIATKKPVHTVWHVWRVNQADSVQANF